MLASLRTVSFTLLLSYVCSLSVHDPRLSPGHLKPLADGRPKIPVEAAVNYPSPDEFFANYVDKKIPLIIHGAATIFPGYTKWSQDYFRKSPDINSMLVSVDRDKKEIHNITDYRHMKFEKFLNRFQKDELYLVDSVKPPLFKDVLLPAPLRCKETRNYLQDTALWYSSGGTKSLFSLSFRDEIACMIRGSNEYLMLPYMKNQDKFQSINEKSSINTIDIDRVDFGKYPQLEDVEWMHAHVNEGDCLYVPYKWAVQVNGQKGNTNENLLITFSFNHVHDHRPKDCTTDPSQATIDKYHFSTLDQEKMQQERMQQEEAAHEREHHHLHANETEPENTEEEDGDHYHDGSEKRRNGDDDIQIFSNLRSYLKKKQSKTLVFSQFMAALQADPMAGMENIANYTRPESFVKKCREIFDILDSNHDSSLTFGDFKRIKNSERSAELLSDLVWRLHDLSTYVNDYIESVHHGVSSQEFEVDRKARELRKKLSIHDPMEL